MRLPTFLVIGAPRSGTTTLHYSLAQHPEIFVSPEKETNFFLFDGPQRPPSGIAAADLDTMQRRAATTWAEYAALFAGATGAHRAIGEASPAYFVCPEVAARIKARLPAARLVAGSITAISRVSLQDTELPVVTWVYDHIDAAMREVPRFENLSGCWKTSSGRRTSTASIIPRRPAAGSRSASWRGSRSTDREVRLSAGAARRSPGAAPPASAGAGHGGAAPIAGRP